MSIEFSDQQKFEFDRAARLKEAERLTPIFHHNFPGQTQNLSKQALTLEILRALDRAAEWGVETRSACVDFSILWLLIGPNFDQSEEVGRFFRFPVSSMAMKTKALMSEFKWRLHLDQQ